MALFSSNKEKNEPTTTYTPPPAQPAVQHTPVAHTTVSSSSTTNIGSGTIIDGQIKIEGDIKIEGTIKGTVTSRGKVLITGSGKVDGDIICQNAEIAGHVTGKLKVADVLNLKANAVIDGDINTGKIMIESGVKFNGNCTMGVAVAKPDTAPKPVTPPTANAS